MQEHRKTPRADARAHVHLGGLRVGFALFVENIIGWFLFFSPGWAIDFPFGLSYQTALSIGLTSYLLLMLTTAVACVGGIVGFICTLLRIEWAESRLETAAFGSGSRPCSGASPR